MKKTISRIANKVLQYSDTPFYMYSYVELVESIRKIKNSLPVKSKIFFASMANDNVEIWNIVRSNNLNLFATSIDHVKTALNSGFLPEQILFASPGISDETFAYLNESGITYILNSVEQVRQCIKCNKAAGSLKIGIRLNIFDFSNGETTSCFDLNNRFGILKEDFNELYGLCSVNNLVISGLQVYNGTNILCYPKLLKSYKNVFLFAETLKTVEFIDLGGGFGVPYKTREDKDFDWQSFSDALNILVQEFDFLKRTTLLFEPGRSIIAQSGYFVTKVTEVVIKHGKCFIITDASVSMFPRPHIYPEACHLVSLAPQNGSPSRKKVIADICGNTIYSKDVLARNVSISIPEIGDHLVFHDAGAYCYSMRSHFLGISFPRQFIVHGNQIKEI